MNQSKSTIYHATILFMLIAIAGVSVHIQGVQAQKSTPSATPKTASPSPATDTESDSTETSKETIDEIKRRIEKNSELVKGVSDTATRLQGLIGEVTRVTGESFTVKTQTATIIMALPESTKITSGTKKIKSSDIAVGNWVSVIGTEIDDTFTPQQISVSAESLRPKPQEVALGTLGEIEKTSFEYTPRGITEKKTVAVVKSSAFEDADGAKAVLTDFETDTAVLIVAQIEDDTLTLATMRSLVPLED